MENNKSKLDISTPDNKLSPATQSASGQKIGNHNQESQLSSLCERIKELENQLGETESRLKKCQNELFSVYISSSWKYTAFLRKFVSAVKRLFFFLYWSCFRKILKSFYFFIPVQIRYHAFFEKVKDKIKDKEV